MVVLQSKVLALLSGVPTHTKEGNGQEMFSKSIFSSGIIFLVKRFVSSRQINIVVGSFF